MSVKSWLCGVHFRGGSQNTQLRTKIILLFVASVLVLVGVNVRNGLGGSLVTFAAARTAYIESNGLTLQNMVLSEHLQIYDDVRGDLQGAQITLRSLSLPNYNIFFQNFESTNAIIDIIACQFGTLQTNTHSTAGLLTMWTFSGVVANNAYFKWGAAMQSFVFFQSKFRGAVDVQHSSQNNFQITNATDIELFSSASVQSVFTIADSSVNFMTVNMERGDFTMVYSRVPNDLVFSRYYGATMLIDQSLVGCFKTNVSVNSGNNVFNITNSVIANGIDLVAQAYNTRLEVWWTVWSSNFGVYTTGLHNSIVAIFNSNMQCDQHLFYLRSGVHRPHWLVIRRLAAPPTQCVSDPPRPRRVCNVFQPLLQPRLAVRAADLNPRGQVILPPLQQHHSQG